MPPSRAFCEVFCAFGLCFEPSIWHVVVEEVVVACDDDGVRACGDDGGVVACGGGEVVVEEVVLNGHVVVEDMAWHVVLTWHTVLP